jgi:anti-sigma factor RsiW
METIHIPYEQLIAYADVESTESESAIVVAHTATCTECNFTVLRFRTIRGLLRADYMYDPPAATVARAQLLFREHWVNPQPRSGQAKKVND